jgi:hypothetical protein
MRVQFRIALACGFGALIGAGIASYVGPSLSWIGLLAAFFFGYLAYDFGKVAAVSKASALKVAENFSTNATERLLRGWYGLGAGLRSTLFILNFTLIPLVLLMAGNYFGLILKDPKTAEGFLQEVSVFVTMAVVLVFLVGLFGSGFVGLLAFLVYTFGENFRDGFDSNWNTQSLLRTGLRWNVVTVVLFWPWYGLYKGLTSIPYRLAGSSIKQFVSLVFIGIHSDIRVLCGSYAAVGAAVGYFGFDSPIIAFFVGGLCGVVQYELVSKRWLKIAVSEN